MANDKEALGAKLAEVAGTETDLLNKINELVTDQGTAFAALQKKIAEGQALDLKAEIQTLSDMNIALQAATSTITKADADAKAAGQ